MTNTIEAFELPFWKTATKLVVFNSVIFSLILLAAPEHVKTQYIPDDAYYYLTLSRNFASLGYWTFDSGISITSGFHPLFAYLLAAAYSLFQPDVTEFVFSGLIWSLIFGFGSIFTLTFVGIREKNILFLMFVCIIISSQNFIYNTVSVTEWSLTLLIALLYGVYFFHNFRKPFRPIDLAILFLLGLLGSIARADFGLFPVSIALAAILLFITKLGSGKQVIFSLSGSIGSVVGLLAVFVHNFVFTGEFLQSSARMKAFWAESTPLRNSDVMELFLEVVGALGFLVLFFITIRVVVLMVFKFTAIVKNRSLTTSISSYISTLQSGLESPRALMVISSTICLIGYAFVYSRNGAIQAWYSVNLIVPFLILILGISTSILPQLGEKTRFSLMILFLSFFVVRLINVYPLGANHSPWPHQEVMRTAGIYLKNNEPYFSDGRIGAWNAGIIGYYQGGSVVNLDGLVNNSIYPFAVSNDLPSYIAEQNIGYIIDFDKMFTSDSRRLRGGYENAAFLEKLVPIERFDNTGTEGWINLTLYQIAEPK